MAYTKRGVSETEEINNRKVNTMENKWDVSNRYWLIASDGFTVYASGSAADEPIRVVARCQTVVIAKAVADAHNATLDNSKSDNPSILNEDWRLRVGDDDYQTIVYPDGFCVNFGEFKPEIAALPDALRALVMVSKCPKPPVPPNNTGDYGLTDIEPEQINQILAVLKKAGIE